MHRALAFARKGRLAAAVCVAFFATTTAAYAYYEQYAYQQKFNPGQYEQSAFNSLTYNHMNWGRNYGGYPTAQVRYCRTTTGTATRSSHRTIPAISGITGPCRTVARSARTGPAATTRSAPSTARPATKAEKGE